MADAKTKNEKRFDVAVTIRNFEIELFWKRSLFFWGFISAAFVGYAALRTSHLRVLIACFGMICSFAWTLVNRGSKYWQESWESKVERFEIPATGAVFAHEESEQFHKGRWLRGRKYSVSKLAIALSDYVFLLLLAIVAVEAARPYVPLILQEQIKEGATTSFIVFSLVYLVLLSVCGRKSQPRRTSPAGLPREAILDRLSARRTGE